MRLPARALLAFAALPLLAGCADEWGTKPSVELKLNGGYVIGNEVTTRFIASPTPEIVLSRTLNGGGFTAFFTLPSAPQPGTFQIVDGTATATVAAGSTVVGVVNASAASTRPATASHRIQEGSMTIVSVAPDKVAGTFKTKITTGSGAPQEFTGRFVAVN